MSKSTEELVRQLISDRENLNVDFKASLNFSSEKQRVNLAADSVAFANAEGGHIVIGVEDKTRSLLGIPQPLDHDRIVQSITDLTDPPVPVTVDSVELDGELVGLIRILKGKQVHQLLRDRTIYIRRDGINYKATPEETVRLYDERDYDSRVYVSEAEKLHTFENGVFMLSGEKEHYRKITKKGNLRYLAESVVFLPEFSDLTPAPEFGRTKGCFLMSYPNTDVITNQEFAKQVREAESRFSALGRYFGWAEPAIFYWSISSNDHLCVGCGSDTLSKAMDDGELGVIAVAACGEFRGAEEQRSFFMVIGAYSKARERDITYVQDREVRFYLSSIPVTSGWLRSLLSPFMEEEKLPFGILSYELVHPRLRVWRPIVPHQHMIPIEGVIRYYAHSPGHSALIGGAIAKTNWFNSRLFGIDTEWRGGNAEGDKDPGERMIDAIRYARELQECPIQLLDECVVSLSPPAFYDDIQKGEVVGFRLPSVKDLELTMRGYRVHILGVTSSPIEA
jgi:Schlafen, AlbA_2